MITLIFLALAAYAVLLLLAFYLKVVGVIFLTALLILIIAILRRIL